VGSCPAFSGVLAKIGYGNLCMREKNLNLNNNNMISELLVYHKPPLSGKFETAKRTTTNKKQAVQKSCYYYLN
jgi:hypothetical protein